MMVIYFSRRRKLIIGAAGMTFLVVSSFVVKESLANFDFLPTQISYSTNAPSTIVKARPNDTGFNSPVANTNFVPPKPEKK